MAAKDRPDAVPHRVAAREHDDPAPAMRGERGDRAGEGLLPRQALGRAGRDHRQMPRAADDYLGGLDQHARRRGEPAEPLIADPDDGEPGSHASPASALTAAAASALPPRRPRSATKSRPRPNSTSASLASAAPTKPTGKPSTSAGIGAPSAIISSRWNSAVGALPIATMAPAKCSRHSSTAAAERVVSWCRAISAARESPRVQTISFAAGNRLAMIPAATILL